MYDYTKILDPNLLNPVEKKIEVGYGWQDHSENMIAGMIDVLLNGKELFKQLEILYGLMISAKLLRCNKKALKSMKFEQRQILDYVVNQVFNRNSDYYWDFYMFCQAKSVANILFNPRTLVTMFCIYRDGILQYLKMIYPDLENFLENTENLINQTIEEIEMKTVIIIPGKVKIVEKQSTYRDDLHLNSLKKKVSSQLQLKK